MLISEQWLREWINPSISLEDIAHQITNAGLEVEGITPLPSLDTQIVVGYVESLSPHPDADKLRCAKVKVEEGAPLLDIVCGAANVAAGQKVPVAKSGSKLLDGTKIKSSKLRGQPSEGMICSLSELGLAETSSGILILDKEAKIGEPIYTHLKLDDKIMEVDLTPNRGDAASYLGVAREIAALNGLDFNGNALKVVNALRTCDYQEFEIQPQVDTVRDIQIQDNACHHYYGRVIENIDLNRTTDSPFWLQEKLRRQNMKSIHPIVDALNLVMLELGQPMHAFDLDKIGQKIIVRSAKANESLQILSGDEVSLKEKTLVIADEKNVLAIAGIMGGLNSGVSSATTSVFLESALFEQNRMVGVARQYGLTTDAAYRFERGVDPKLAPLALEYATLLITTLCGGQVGPVVHKVAKAYESRTIIVRAAQVKRLLGLALSDADIEAFYKRLGFEFKTKLGSGSESQTIWEITPPSHRYDLSIEVDIIEEIGRLYGIDKIEVVPPFARIQMHPIPEAVLSTRRLKRSLIESGLQEVITYSFVSPTLQETLAPGVPVKALLNPISSNLSVMRTTLLGGLLESLSYNQKRQQDRMRLFEVGMCFEVASGELKQFEKIAGLFYGPRFEKHWDVSQKAAPKVDFYDIKGIVEKLISLTKKPEAFRFESGSVSSLHPGQSAIILKDNIPVGYIGGLHPSIEKTLEIEGPVFVFELELAALLDVKVPRYEAISRFPSIQRDLAVTVDAVHPVGDLLSVVQSSAGQLLRSACVFDVYQGKGIATGQKSVAMDLILQHTSRTLVDKEVDEIMQKVITALRDKFGAELRV